MAKAGAKSVNVPVRPRFVVQDSAFRAAVALACEAIERRTSIPILSNVKIVADGAVTITSTDLDNELSLTIPAEVQAPGVSIPPAHCLRSLAPTLVGPVECDHDGDSFVVRSGAFGASLHTLPAEDFPTMRMGKPLATFTLPAPVLRDALLVIRPAYSTEETRFYLNGAFMQPKDGALRFVATDGHKLMCLTVPLPLGAEKLKGTIIHRTCIKILLAAIAERADDVTVEVSDEKVRFSWPGGVLLGKVIDGTYPDVDRVVPATGEIVAAFDAASLKPAIARLRAFIQERDRAIIFNLEEGSAVLRMNSPESGSASERVDATLTGKPLEIGLNNSYIEQLLPFEGGVRLTMIDAASPVRIDYDTRPDAFSVLMPMRF